MSGAGAGASQDPDDGAAHSWAGVEEQWQELWHPVLGFGQGTNAFDGGSAHVRAVVTQVASEPVDVLAITYRGETVEARSQIPGPVVGGSSQLLSVPGRDIDLAATGPPLGSFSDAGGPVGEEREQRLSGEVVVLFWGLRGGGGNFGVVTSFEFRLHPLGPMVTAGLVAWPMDDAPAVLRLFRQVAAEAPDELGILANLRRAAALPTVPVELHGKPIVALVVCYAGTVEEGERVVRPIREFGTPVLDTVMPKPYVGHQKMFDLAVPDGLHYYWKGHKLPPLSDELIDVIVEHASRITSPLTTNSIYTMGGAVARVDDDATAFANRSAAHEINITAAWQPDDPEPERHIEWVRSFFGALEPHSRGVYVNYINDDAAERVREAAYGPEKWRRLVALKGKYDPTNFFRFNANIPPKGP